MYNENVTAYFNFSNNTQLKLLSRRQKLPLLRLAAKEALFHKQQIWRRGNHRAYDFNSLVFQYR